MKNAACDTYRNDNFLRGRPELLELIEIKRTEENHKQRRDRSRRGSDIDSQLSQDSSDQSGSVRNKRAEFQRDMTETAERISRLESILLKLHNESRKSLKDTDFMKVDVQKVKSDLAVDWGKLTSQFTFKKDGIFKMRSRIFFMKNLRMEMILFQISEKLENFL